ncbi:ATP phosphoribosyltransferase regulatory subunit [Usitatibacter palustris]|uniref:ATP phosphoribosyltransferase regulatory subunit n=1 Tax=Usitatibacter palustris TaxID=2732487 RepID=A0A6M4HAJ5_9PROT|nr:ATP phosphoribosyltransferase regulatory subunit [Usitatibacter palustris]QJR15693.1 ATP phosphoribosyltransferase regulatory subunit [Usitatibacter palustris]
MRRWLLPEHIEDVLPAEARAIERLRRGILDLFERAGYELVAPPLLEFVESLLSGTGKDLDLATFKLVDRISGRTMGVRADHTPQVARIDAHLLNRQGVARLCYCGSVLHTVPSGITNSREPLQIGAELYGHAGVEADIEIARLMIAALKATGVAKVHVDLGNPAIYRALVGDAGLNAEDAEVVFHAVQQKNAAEAKGAAVLTGLHGGIDTIERARKALPAKPAIGAALDALARVAQACRAAGAETSIDLAELGGFNYESGIVFAAFTPGSPDAIARGGRYDEVGASFGRARPATGFTMDLRQLAALAPEAAKRGAILAPCIEDAALAAEVARLREAGEVVIDDLPGHEAARDELGCDRKLEKKDGKWRVTS